MDEDRLTGFKAKCDQYAAQTQEFLPVFMSHYERLQELGFSKELSDQLLLAFADRTWEWALLGKQEEE